MHLALDVEEAGLRVVDDQQRAAVDDQVESAVGAGERLAQLRVLVDADGDAWQRLTIACDDAPAQHGHTLRVNGAGGNAALDRVAAAVQELGRGEQVGGDAGVQRRRHGARIGRQRLGWSWRGVGGGVAGGDDVAVGVVVKVGVALAVGEAVCVTVGADVSVGVTVSIDVAVGDA